MKRITLSLVAATFLLSSAVNAYAFGAIAVDDEEGRTASETGYGYSTQHSSRESAEQAALRQCQSAGNSNCKVAVWFEKCGAYAGSRERYGIGWGASDAIARNQALSACGAGCRIVISACD